MFVEINTRDANNLGVRDGEQLWVDTVKAPLQEIDLLSFQENAAAANLTLTADDLERIDEVTPPGAFGNQAGVERGSLRNRAYLLGPDGSLAGRYDKVKLLAFGEYMPFSNWIPQLKGLVKGVGDFRPGDVVYVILIDVEGNPSPGWAVEVEDPVDLGIPGPPGQPVAY